MTAKQAEETLKGFSVRDMLPDPDNSRKLWYWHFDQGKWYLASLLFKGVPTVYFDIERTAKTDENERKNLL